MIVSVTPLSRSQQGTSHSAGEAAAPSPNAPPSKGSIEQQTYKNPSIGLEFTPAENLHLEDPEIVGTPGTAKWLVKIKAIENGLFSGLLSPRDVMIFYADALANYPDNQRSTPLYVDKLMRTNKALGYRIVNDATEGPISGIPFVRIDFVKDDVHESAFVTTHNGYAFVFLFAGSDFAAINKMIASTKVKLTP